MCLHWEECVSIIGNTAEPCMIRWYHWQGGLERALIKVRGSDMNEVYWGNMRKNSINMNVKPIEGKYVRRWYKCKPKLNRELIYNGGLSRELYFQERTDSLESSGRIYHWPGEGGNELCQCCDERTKESSDYVFPECGLCEREGRVCWMIWEGFWNGCCEVKMRIQMLLMTRSERLWRFNLSWW